MKINITKEQYPIILKSLSLLENMEAIEESQEKALEAENLLNYFCTFAKDLSAEDCVDMLDYSDFISESSDMPEEVKEDMRKEHGKTMVSEDIDQEAFFIAERYLENSFWEKVIERLVNRDIANEFSEEDIKKHTEKREKRERKLWSMYYDEILKNGIKNFELKTKTVSTN